VQRLSSRRSQCGATANAIGDDLTRTGDITVRDVAFYNFEEPNPNGIAIFAYVCAQDVVICRIQPGAGQAYDEMRRICDLQDQGTLYGLTWALRDGQPALCVYGETALVKVYNPFSGMLEQVRIFHASLQC
jgi:hypothetical protein